ncbi:MAG: hypothetical protein J1G01_00795 [Clostridiales bacterium]|nr:hypothetical protein [Clostridiales bacterium]
MDDIFYDDSEVNSAASNVEQNAVSDPKIDYEQKSYGKIGYKRVQKLRKKGARRGIIVPKLCYELHKPEKPRVAFRVVAALAIVFLIGVMVAIGFLFNELIKMSDSFTGLGDVFKVVFNPTAFTLSLGLSVLPALVIVLAYIMLFALFLVPLCVGLYLYSFVRSSFYLAICSKEEFAKGSIVGDRIRRLAIIVIISTLIWIVGLVMIKTGAGKLFLSLGYFALIIVVGGLLAILLVEKKKNEKWFETLDEDKKRNYLEHEAALRSVKRKMRNERTFWGSFFR